MVPKDFAFSVTIAAGYHFRGVTMFTICHGTYNSSYPMIFLSFYVPNHAQPFVIHGYGHTWVRGIENRSESSDCIIFLGRLSLKTKRYHALSKVCKSLYALYKFINFSNDIFLEWLILILLHHMKIECCGLSQNSAIQSSNPHLGTLLMSSHMTRSGASQ